MRRIISIFLIFVTVFACSCFSAFAEESKPSLEEVLAMTDSDALAYLVSVGLILPDVYVKEPKEAEKAIRIVLNDLYYHPDAIETYNFTKLYLLATRVRDIVGSNVVNNRISPAGLVYSTESDSWHSYYNNYNCYAYALGYSSYGFDPGEFSLQTWSSSMTVYATANMIADDLQALGYSTSVSTTKPSSLGGGEKLIAVRKYSGDYHVMKASSLTVWRHKPGHSVPLRWNYSSLTPSGVPFWTNEALIATGYFAPTIWYYGTIYYIKYWS